MFLVFQIKANSWCVSLTCLSFIWNTQYLQNKKVYSKNILKNSIFTNEVAHFTKIIFQKYSFLCQLYFICKNILNVRIIKIYIYDGQTFYGCSVGPVRRKHNKWRGKNSNKLTRKEEKVFCSTSFFHVFPLSTFLSPTSELMVFTLTIKMADLFVALFSHHRKYQRKTPLFSPFSIIKDF